MLFSPFQKPKQKRHRCRNPNKLDINTLTGEERVPVVNKRNGKKVKIKLVPVEVFNNVLACGKQVSSSKLSF